MRRDQQRERVIVERKTAGATLQQIADEFGVTRERIRQIVSRHAREHAPAPDAPTPQQEG